MGQVLVDVYVLAASVSQRSWMPTTQPKPTETNAGWPARAGDGAARGQGEGLHRSVQAVSSRGGSGPLLGGW